MMGVFAHARCRQLRFQVLDSAPYFGIDWHAITTEANVQFFQHRKPRTRRYNRYKKVIRGGRQKVFYSFGKSKLIRLRKGVEIWHLGKFERIEPFGAPLVTVCPALVVAPGVRDWSFGKSYPKNPQTMMERVKKWLEMGAAVATIILVVVELSGMLSK